ncbi:haloacetate dehalogenase [Fusarium denticulatum]|uniref:Haloacetate dehalogenase n=1 Tax=Fusarium denticulatum TaxID=48507 RepID=A0A8H5TLJ3_9HYPO|nr:haloacetate dehalogenase [Fusarium denticulatum]
MTFRNLNQTWRDVIFKQYDADYQADNPFPITYLIFAPDWNSQDLLFTIPHKITLKTLKDAIRDFIVQQRVLNQFTTASIYQLDPESPCQPCQHKPKFNMMFQLKFAPAALILLAKACSAWDFEVWPDKHYLGHTLASWTRKKTLDDFDERAHEEYRKAYCNGIRIHSTCEDCRAGAFLDKIYDEKDVNDGNKIQAPMLAIWGNAGVSAESLKNKSEGPLEIWQKYARNVRGKALECGHFIPEEDSEGLAEVLVPFLLE